VVLKIYITTKCTLHCGANHRRNTETGAAEISEETLKRRCQVVNFRSWKQQMQQTEKLGWRW